MSLKPERKKLLADLVESNTTITKMHNEYGFNYKTIRKHYPHYRKGVTESTEVRKKIAANREQIEALSKERAPGMVIAEAIGVSRPTLSKYFPDLMWSREEVAAFGAMVRQVNKTSEWGKLSVSK